MFKAALTKINLNISSETNLPNESKPNLDSYLLLPFQYYVLKLGLPFKMAVINKNRDIVFD